MQPVPTSDPAPALPRPPTLRRVAPPADRFVLPDVAGAPTGSALLPRPAPVKPLREVTDASGTASSSAGFEAVVAQVALAPGAAEGSRPMLPAASDDVPTAAACLATEPEALPQGTDLPTPASAVAPASLESVALAMRPANGPPLAPWADRGEAPPAEAQLGTAATGPSSGKSLDIPAAATAPVGPEATAAEAAPAIGPAGGSPLATPAVRGGARTGPARLAAAPAGSSPAEGATTLAGGTQPAGTETGSVTAVLPPRAEGTSAPPPSGRAGAPPPLAGHAAVPSAPEGPETIATAIEDAPAPVAPVATEGDRTEAAAAETGEDKAEAPDVAIAIPAPADQPAPPQPPGAPVPGASGLAVPAPADATPSAHVTEAPPASALAAPTRAPARPAFPAIGGETTEDLRPSPAERATTDVAEPRSLAEAPGAGTAAPAAEPRSAPTGIGPQAMAPPPVPAPSRPEAPPPVQTPAPPVFRDVPLGGVPVEIGLRTLEGSRRFDIRLAPEALGQIEIRLDIDGDGAVRATLAVERPETLASLQRDSGQLERALEGAGFRPAEGGLSLFLRDRPNGGTGGHGHAPHPGPGGIPAPNSSGDAESAIARPLRLRASGIDLRI